MDTKYQHSTENDTHVSACTQANVCALVYLIEVLLIEEAKQNKIVCSFSKPFQLLFPKINVNFVVSYR